MKQIRNVIICGLGAIGSIYAEKISNCPSKILKILVDEKRLEKYTQNPISLNNKVLDLEYILPNDTTFQADLIIISTKSSGLNEAIKNIKNFINPETIIISLINGITSEKLIAQKYGEEKILYSYFLGHSSMRDGSNIIHDGVNSIFFGTNKKMNTEKVETLKAFFEETNINYEIPKDIIYSMWLKFLLNVASNQISAILGFTFGEMYSNKKCMLLIEKIIKEVILLAKAEGIKNTENMLEETLSNIKTMTYNGKTSMLQDIMAKRETEVELFAGTVIELGKKHNIQTPYNQILKLMLESIQENYLT